MRTTPKNRLADQLLAEEINPACFAGLEEQGIPTVPSEVIQSSLPGGGFGLRAAATEKEIDPNGVYVVGQYTGFHYPNINHTTYHHVPVLTPFQEKRKFDDIIDDKNVELGDTDLGLASICNHSCLANTWARIITQDGQSTVILLTYGWVIQEKQELCINYGDGYFHKGVPLGSMINQGCFFSPQDRRNLKRYLTHIEDYQILPNEGQGNVADINDKQLTASGVLNFKKFIGQKILCDLCGVISFAPLIKSLIDHPDSEFTIDEKANSKRFFKEITENKVATGGEFADFYRSVNFEHDLTKKLLSLEGMDTFLLSGQWDKLVGHPMIQANMPLPFKKLNIDFSCAEHREIMNKATDFIGFIGRVYAFENTLLHGFETEEITLPQALEVVLSFWSNMEHAISQAINNRDYAGFYTETMIDLICDISAIHRLKNIVDERATTNRGHDSQIDEFYELVNRVVANIDEIIGKCRELVQSIPQPELTHGKVTFNPTAKFYKWLKIAFKTVDPNTVTRLTSIYTPQWNKRGAVKSVSEEEHQAYLEKFRSNDDAVTRGSAVMEGSTEAVRVGSGLQFFSQPNAYTPTSQTIYKP